MFDDSSTALGAPGAEEPSHRAGPVPLTRRVLLIEDEASIAEPLVEALRSHGFAVDHAATAAAAARMVRRPGVDVVLLDLRLPDGSGLDVFRGMERSGAPPVLMLTALGDELDRILGLELGAADYIVKPYSAREVVARIRAVLRRVGKPADAVPAVLRQGALVLDRRARSARLGASDLRLTDTEFDVLWTLLLRAGGTVTRADLLEAVWGISDAGVSRRLDVLVGQLRRKLGDDARQPRWIMTDRGEGFRLPGGNGP